MTMAVKKSVEGTPRDAGDAEDRVVDDVVYVGKMGVVVMGKEDSKEGSGSDEATEASEPTLVILTTDVEVPVKNGEGRILLARDSNKSDENGRISVATPLPFLGYFTSFDRGFKKPKPPPKVQSRWKLLKIPLRQELPPKRPETEKHIHPLEAEWEEAPGWVRAPVPIDVKTGRRILHSYPVSGDKDHLFKLLIPSGNYQKRRGGGWICRRWIGRSKTRKPINHTPEEMAEVQKQLERRDARRQARFDEVFGEVWNGITGKGEGIMKDTDDLVSKENAIRAERKQEMYDQWDLNVFNYIQRQTQDKINDRKYRADQVSARNTALQRKYCDAVKKQRKIFLDIIHKEEYDPFEFRNKVLKYSNKDLYDPVKHDWSKDQREKKFMGEKVSLKAQTREILDLANWPEKEYKSCMAGHVTCDDELQDRLHLAAVPEKWLSKDVFWQKRFGPEFWHTSFPKGGKCCDVPTPMSAMQMPEPQWRGIRIVWDVDCKKQRKLQISVDNPNF